jgi:hypothetical protein
MDLCDECLEELVLDLDKQRERMYLYYSVFKSLGNDISIAAMIHWCHVIPRIVRKK